METQQFFFLSNVQPLIDEALKAGGSSLGFVITPQNATMAQPTLQVSYLLPAEVLGGGDDEHLTDPTDGCPYPPRCD